ncbi:DNRLRE domain-containing protein [Streptomyces sp. NPDC002513]
MLLAMAAETALVSQDTGLAFADTASGVTAKPAHTHSRKATGPAQAQDEVSAVLMARQQHRKIEVLSKRTADSTTYALPSGELETDAYAGPVRVKQGGAWKDIDTTPYDGGGHTARSYLKFDMSNFKGKHITSATMSLYSYYSASCSSTANTQAKRVTSTLDTNTLTWGAQPSTTTTNMATNTGHWGYDYLEKYGPKIAVWVEKVAGKTVGKWILEALSHVESWVHSKIKK